MDCTRDAAPAIVSYPFARVLRKIVTSAFETWAVRPVVRVKINCNNLLFDGRGTAQARGTRLGTR